MNSGTFDDTQNAQSEFSSSDPGPTWSRTGRQPEAMVESLLDLATGAAERYASDKKVWLANAIVDLAAGVRQSGRRFEGEQEWLAEAIDKGAGRVRDFAEDLRGADVRDLYNQGRVFARQRPKLVLAGAIAAGIVAISVARRVLAGNMAPRAARAA